MGAAIGDSPEAVAENRRRVSEALRLPAEPVWLEQVHGTHVVALGGPALQVLGGRGDAVAVQARCRRCWPSRRRRWRGRFARVVTGRVGGPGRGSSRACPRGCSVAWGPGRVCAIRVADCMPVLFAARDGSAVGAAHAGWRGLAGGVLEATVGRLGVPASQLIAWMGPAIGQANFEVGDDVRTGLHGDGPGGSLGIRAECARPVAVRPLRAWRAVGWRA